MSEEKKNQLRKEIKNLSNMIVYGEIRDEELKEMLTYQVRTKIRKLLEKEK